MKDNISIIFAAIIGTLLIVILPLYSILDRQDSMSYNVVLTQTTNFVDKVRSTGFIDKDTYYNYIYGLGSTGNTYKVNIEVYKKTLIHETDKDGKIIKDSYVEDIELFNTKDILNVIDGETSNVAEDTNEKSNVYLLDVNDEIYVKVYNTNTTAGSIIYKFISGNSNIQVINISYGGVVNKIDWELYEKISSSSLTVPEVILGVPVNAANSSNIYKITETGEEEIVTNEDIDTSESLNYVYRYDLQNEANKTIRLSAEFKNIDSIIVGTEIIKLEDMTTEKFNQVKAEIIKEYIQLNGMYANIDLVWRGKKDYYVLDIVLTNVALSSLQYMTNIATVVVLPGIGQDSQGSLAFGAESVELELTDVNSIHSVMISSPHIWEKLLKTKSLPDSIINNERVYVGEELAFLIEYTGINRDVAEIKEAVEQNLIVEDSETDHTEIEVFTPDELKTGEYKLEIPTRSVLVKFKYTENNNYKNYIKLPSAWMRTNLEEIVDSTDVEGFTRYAEESKSSEYLVLSDKFAPEIPSILLEGIEGNNGWYKSTVKVDILGATVDNVGANGEDGIISVPGGSGVWKNTYQVTGATTISENESFGTELVNNGTSHIVASSYDYVSNVATTSAKEVKIDTIPPSAPKITLNGAEGTNNWYTSEVDVNITPGLDNMSGMSKMTYEVTGAGSMAMQETTGTAKLKITAEGKSTIIITAIDNAGNETKVTKDLYIDKTIPADAKIEIIEGTLGTNNWYTSNVKVRITINSNDSVSGLADSQYRITGTGDEVPKTAFSETVKDIVISSNGTHNITVYTNTKAGNYKTTSYTLKIDKDKPQNAGVTVNSGTPGENGWYTSDVTLKVEANNDVGSSGIKSITYKLTGEMNTQEREISSGNFIEIDDEGIYSVNVTTWDNAGNYITETKEIKIDKSVPVAANIVVTGTKGKNDWYVSNVGLEGVNASDNVSGIQSVVLDKTSISEETTGTKVTATTKNNAGLISTSEITVKIDKTAPSEPTINLDTPTGTGISGVYLYNKDVNVNITGGLDNIDGNSVVEKTTYEVTSNGGSTVIIPETIGNNFVLSDNGLVTITARTYNSAGLVSQTAKVVWINKEVPVAPVIQSINDTNVQGVATQTITSEDNVIRTLVSGLTTGNMFTLTAINQEDYTKLEKEDVATSTSQEVTTNLANKATYLIAIKQKNMFGTWSNSSSGLYYYEYK